MVDLNTPTHVLFVAHIQDGARGCDGVPQATVRDQTINEVKHFNE
jgi:hypothetical protein